MIVKDHDEWRQALRSIDDIPGDDRGRDTASRESCGRILGQGDLRVIGGLADVLLHGGECGKQNDRTGDDDGKCYGNKAVGYGMHAPV